MSDWDGLRRRESDALIRNVSLLVKLYGHKNRPNLFPVIDIPSPLLALADPQVAENTSKEHKKK